MNPNICSLWYGYNRTNRKCVHGYVKQPDCTIIIAYDVEKKYKLVSVPFGNASEIYVLPDKHDHTQHGRARTD